MWTSCGWHRDVWGISKTREAMSIRLMIVQDQITGTFLPMPHLAIV